MKSRRKMGGVGVFKDNKSREAETAKEKRNWHESGQRGRQLPDQAGEAVEWNGS